MQMISNRPPVIRKVVRGKVKHARHGGAWKVAYADFMTAMMAFFLLLWLLSEAPQEKSTALAAYFNPDLQLSSIGADGVLSGVGIDPEEGLYQSGSPIDQPVTSDVVGPDAEETEGQTVARAQNPWLGFSDGVGIKDGTSRIETVAQADPDPSITSAYVALGAFLDSRPDQAHVSLLEDGSLQIDLLDPAGQPLFLTGGFGLTPELAPVLQQIVATLQVTPGRVVLIGHSDSTPLAKPEYSNWELSSDRALAIRRALISAGLDPERISSVSGVADKDPLDAAAPGAPSNRRVTIQVIPVPATPAK